MTVKKIACPAQLPRRQATPVREAREAEAAIPLRDMEIERIRDTVNDDRDARMGTVQCAV